MKTTNFAVAAILSLCAASATAAGLDTTISRVDLAQERETITLTSTDPQPANVRADVFRWTPEGLQPTRDVIAIPAIFVMEPGAKRGIDVHTDVPRGAAERAYRVVFSVNDQPALSIPVFVPPSAGGRPQITARRDGDGLVLKNEGAATEHVRKTVTASGMTSDVSIFVLPGQEVRVLQ